MTRRLSVPSQLLRSHYLSLFPHGLFCLTPHPAPTPFPARFGRSRLYRAAFPSSPSQLSLATSSLFLRPASIQCPSSPSRPTPAPRAIPGLPSPSRPLPTGHPPSSQLLHPATCRSFPPTQHFSLEKSPTSYLLVLPRVRQTHPSALAHTQTRTNAYAHSYGSARTSYVLRTRDGPRSFPSSVWTSLHCVLSSVVFADISWRRLPPPLLLRVWLVLPSPLAPSSPALPFCVVCNEKGRGPINRKRFFARLLTPPLPPTAPLTHPPPFPPLPNPSSRLPPLTPTHAPTCGVPFAVCALRCASSPVPALPSVCLLPLTSPFPLSPCNTTTPKEHTHTHKKKRHKTEQTPKGRALWF